MTYEGWLTIGVVALLLVALLKNLAPTDVLFVAVTTLFAATGIISADEAFAGFSNSGVLTVAFLFVVVAGLRETGVLDQVGHHVLGNAKTPGSALLRLSTVVMPMSAFLNNTPIVAMFVPIVMDWCRATRSSDLRSRCVAELIAQRHDDSRRRISFAVWCGRAGRASLRQSHRRKNW